LHKYLADAGIASRRASEQIILAGRVSVNGQVIRELGTQVDPAHDRVTIEGKKVEPRRKLYIALNKPRGYVSTRSDPEGRRTLQSLLPKEWGFLYSVGRLDMDSDGLILLTNDGDFCQRITHPRYGVLKKYRVTVEGQLEPDLLHQLTKGLWHEGELLRVEKARLLERFRPHSLVELELAEGKNREVRRLFEALRLRISRLQRIQVGKIRLGELPQGKWRTLTKSEIKSLLPEL
jgi:23S rRNA pseudouridine2605 synthase